MRKFMPLSTSRTPSPAKLMLGFCLLISLLSQPVSVAALSAEQKAIFDKGITYYDHEIVEAGEGDTTAAPGGPLSGCSNAEKIWNGLLGKLVHGQPLSQQQVAGIMGNMTAESGFYPNRVQGRPPEQGSDSADISGGYGIVQWTPGRKIIPEFDRLKNTFDPPAEKHSDLGFQIQLLLDQLNGVGGLSESAAGQDLITQTTTEGAVRSFMLKFERPRDQSESAIQDRIPFGTDAFNKGTSGSWCG